MARPSIRFGIARNLDESAPLNQRHHHILQTQSLALEFFIRRCRSYILWLTDDDAHFGKWFWNNEAIPTFYPPAARIFHVNRDDWRSGFLREKNDSGSEFVNRATRSVGRN